MEWNPNTEPKIRRQVTEHNITIVGLDAHKNSIEIVTAETAGNQEVRHYGKIGGDMASLDKAIRKLRSVRSKGAELRFVYEAGPCGYEIYRHLTKQGFQCVVVAPSLIPKKSGARIKNDRRDAENLARLERAGELTKVYAHSDDASYKVQPFSINGYPTAILGAPFFKLSKPEVETLQNMIGKTNAEIYRELQELIRKIENA